MQTNFLCLAATPVRPGPNLEGEALRRHDPNGLAGARPSNSQHPLISDDPSLFTNSAFPLAALLGLCQDHNMKQFLLGCLLWALIIPTLSIAQTAQLTEQLGKTVLYEDTALSPDGSHVAWVQSTAATTSKQISIQATSGDRKSTRLNSSHS